MTTKMLLMMMIKALPPIGLKPTTAHMTKMLLMMHNTHTHTCTAKRVLMVKLSKRSTIFQRRTATSRGEGEGRG
jgi:hypothetical protein